MKKIHTLLVLHCLLHLPLGVMADLPKNNSPEELERWFNSNEEEWRPQDINEGSLRFLTTAPKIRPHRADNHITISARSISTGWVSLKQCHYDLDNLPAAQIVYNKHKVKNIRILRSSHIEKTWVEDNSVQMKHIHPGSMICVRAELQALKTRAAGEYTLTTGPYRRKFLDGYFPMLLSLSIDYPADLRLVDTQPRAQAGYTIKQTGDKVLINTLFEGELTTHLTFLHQNVTDTPL